MANVERFDELVSRYFDDALEPGEAAELNAMLAARPECARRFVTLSRIHGSLREVQDSLVPAADSEGEVLKRWLAARPRRWVGSSVASAAMAAAALLALAFLLRPPEVLVGPTVGAQGAPEALFVVGKVDPSLAPGDLAVQDRLVRLGFRVTPVKEDVATAERARGKALVLISESTRSDLIGGRLRDVPVPILNCEPHLNYTLMLSRREGLPTEHFAKTRRFRIRILNPEHPLAAGLKDMARVYEPRGTVGWGLPAEAATLVAASDDNPEHIAIFAYEKGAEVRGERLAGRRVSFFLSDTTQDATLLTPDGWQLFDAAVRWLTSGR